MHLSSLAKRRSGRQSDTYLHCGLKRLPWQHSVYYQTTSVWAHRGGSCVIGVDTQSGLYIFFFILSPVLLHSSVNSRSGAHRRIRLLHSEVSAHVWIKCKRIPFYFVYCYCQGIKSSGKKRFDIFI